MEQFQLPIIVLLIIGIGYFITTQIRALKKEMAEKESGQVLMEWLKANQQSVQQTVEKQLQGNREEMSKQFLGQTKVINEQLALSAKTIADVRQSLGGVHEFGKGIKDLNDILKSPKLRGNLGEKFLYEILENYLPKSMYKTQYRFRSGEACDAVIVTDRGMIPVDSKFPMEEFSKMLKAESDSTREEFHKEFIKSVKKHVDKIASKYILPGEGTTDQAIMYIPSESVYYEAVVRTAGIEDYAQRKGVLITSPNTFTSFVNIVMIGYRQHELAANAGEILKALSGIQVEAQKFESDLNILDGHISDTGKSMDKVRSKFGKLSNKLEQVQSLGEAEAKIQEPLLPESG